MTVTATNMERAGAAGCIEATVKVINTYIDNTDICKKGCKALRNIILNNCNKFQQQVALNNKTDNNKIRAGKVGAINSVLDVLKEHISNYEVCKEGCDVLSNMIYAGKYYASLVMLIRIHLLKMKTRK